MDKFTKGFLTGIFVCFFSLFCGVMLANAESVQTTVTVTIVEEVSSASISAAVPVTEFNTPEEIVEVSLWTKVVNFFKNLIY